MSKPTVTSRGLCDVTPWAIDATTAGRMVERLSEVSDASAFGEPAAKTTQYQTVNGIAIIDVFGVITPESTFWGRVFGDETTHSFIRGAVSAAAEDSAVQAIVLSFDSPGGAAKGLQQLADDVAALGQKKPIYSHARGLMASAAYFIGSQTKRIYSDPEALVGSVGTILMLYDWSKFYEKAGVKAEPFVSGPLKGAGAMGTSLTDGQRTYFQELVDDTAAVFKAAVARGRSMTADEVNKLATGGVMAGARAQRAGLVDQVATLNQALADIAKGLPAKSEPTNQRPSGAVPAATSAGVTPQVHVETAMFEKWLAARGVNPAELSDEEKDALRAEYDQEVASKTATATADPPPVTEKSDSKVDVKAEAVRIRKLASEITAECIKHGKPDLAAKLIDDCDTLADAKAKLLDAIDGDTPEPPTGQFAVHVRDHDRDAFPDAIVQGLAMREGLPLITAKSEDKRKAQEQAANIAQDRDFAGMSCTDLCRESIRMDAARGNTRVCNAPMHGDGMINAAFSTVTLPYVLGAIANKSMLAGLEEVPSTAMLWCGRKSVSNFHQHTATRLGEHDSLQEVAPGGEIEHEAPSEIHETFQAKTYGRQGRFTRTQVINDDLGALVEYGRNMGGMWNRLIDDLVYAKLAYGATSPTMSEDTYALFSASHASANYATGTTNSTLNDTGLAYARKLLSQMKDAKGVARLNLLGTILIVPPELTHTAEVLVKSAQIWPVSTSGGGDYNAWYNQFKIITEPRLSDSSVTGYSTTRWYMAANQIGGAMSIVLSFLNGRATPTLERINPNVIPDALVGLAWRIYGDVGADAIGWRGIVMMAGA